MAPAISSRKRNTRAWGSRSRVSCGPLPLTLLRLPFSRPRVARISAFTRPRATAVLNAPIRFFVFPGGSLRIDKLRCLLRFRLIPCDERLDAFESSPM